MNTDLSSTARALFSSLALSTKPTLPPMKRRFRAPDFRFSSQWHQRGVSRSSIPVSKEYGSLSHCALIVIPQRLNTSTHPSRRLAPPRPPMPPLSSLTTCACHTHTRAHFTPQHWLLCHMGLYLHPRKRRNTARRPGSGGRPRGRGFEEQGGGMCDYTEGVYPLLPFCLSVCLSVCSVTF